MAETWETVCEEREPGNYTSPGRVVCTTSRLRVPGGWLYRVLHSETGLPPVIQFVGEPERPRVFREPKGTDTTCTRCARAGGE